MTLLNLIPSLSAKKSELEEILQYKSFPLAFSSKRPSIKLFYLFRLALWYRKKSNTLFINLFQQARNNLQVHLF